MPEARVVKEEGKTFTVYPIEVLMERPQESFPTSWTVQRRYSEFESLHIKLKSLFPSVGQLEFPGKMLKGLMQMTTQLTEARRKGLEKYIKVIIARIYARLFYIFPRCVIIMTLSNSSVLDLF